MCHVPFLSCCFAIAVNVTKHELCELAVNHMVQFHVFVIFLICYVSCYSVYTLSECLFSKCLAFNRGNFFKTKLKVEEDSRPRSMDNSGKVSEKSYKLLSHFPVLVGKEIQISLSLQ